MRLPDARQHKDTRKNHMEFLMKTTLQKNMQRQKGLTAIELIIGIVVIGLFFAFVVPLIKGAKDKNAMSLVETSSMSRTYEGIYDRYQGELIDENLDNEEVLRQKVIAEGYKIVGTDTIYNAWGGEITITGVADNGLEWESTKIPATACPALVEETKRIGFETVNIGGTDFQYSDTTASDRAAGCETAAGSSDEITITWIRTEV